MVFCFKRTRKIAPYVTFHVKQLLDTQRKKKQAVKCTSKKQFFLARQKFVLMVFCSILTVVILKPDKKLTCLHFCLKKDHMNFFEKSNKFFFPIFVASNATF